VKQLSVLGEAIMARLHLSLTITTAFAITTALVAFCEAAGAQGQLETRIRWNERRRSLGKHRSHADRLRG
jgi:hypothetical protein